MDWSGGEGSNIRLSRIHTKSSSYQTYCLENDCTCSSLVDSDETATETTSDAHGNKNE